MSVTEWSMEERRWDMTLVGQTVLEVRMRLPKLVGDGRAADRMRRHYQRLERLWTAYARRELYLYACLELARKQEQGRRFRPWQGRLEGRISWQQGGIVGMEWTWWERRGFCQPESQRWGDAWNAEAGHVCLLRAFAPHKRWAEHWLRTRSDGEKLERIQTFFPDGDGLHMIDRRGREGIVRIS